MTDETQGSGTPPPDTVAADPAYARPAGVRGGFEPRHEPQRYRPPPPTVDPEDRQTFGRPDDARAADFAPLPGERVGPRHAAPPPVPNVLADAYGAPPSAAGGFAPAPGTRLPPTGPAPESPWWKPDAVQDPWRDPNAPVWLGRGAVFTGGRPEQLDPWHDQAADAADLPDAASAGGVDEELDDGDRPSDVRRLRFGLPALVLVLIVALVAGLIGGGAGWLLTRTVVDGLHRPDVSIAKVRTPKVQRPPTSVAGIAKRVGPAVVSIAVDAGSGLAIGSGVVIDSDGDVLTNNHVISGAVGDKKASIVVTFSNEDTAVAQVVGRDATSDLAVLKVPNDRLTVAQLGDSDQLAVGDPVIAIGSPLGLQGTVTAGIVSALNRPVHVYADDGSSDAYLDAIQTDAPINPGNSGGALVDSAGAVIGINSAAATGTNGSGTTTSGIGYAIPIDYARTIATELIHTGRAVHATLGAQGRTVVSGVHVGGYLEQVVPRGAAAKAGLQTGDVVIAAGGTVIQSFDQLVVLVQQRKPGDRLSLTYYPRDSAQKKTTTVVLG